MTLPFIWWNLWSLNYIFRDKAKLQFIRVIFILQIREIPSSRILVTTLKCMVLIMKNYLLLDTFYKLVGYFTFKEPMLLNKVCGRQSIFYEFNNLYNFYMLILLSLWSDCHSPRIIILKIYQSRLYYYIIKFHWSQLQSTNEYFTGLP